MIAALENSTINLGTKRMYVSSGKYFSNDCVFNLGNNITKNTD